MAFFLFLNEIMQQMMGDKGENNSTWGENISEMSLCQINKDSCETENIAPYDLNSSMNSGQNSASKVIIRREQH